MSRSAEILLPLGDEERRFRLLVGEWQRVQEATDRGPAEVLAHLAISLGAQRQVLELFPSLAGELGRLRAREVRAVLYHGLVGGGLEPNKAGALIRELVDGRPLLEQAPTAFAAALAGLVGAEDEPTGERAGEGKEPGRRSPTASSGSASSMPPPSAPGSGPTRSTAGRSGSSRSSTPSSRARPPKTGARSSPRPASS